MPLACGVGHGSQLERATGLRRVGPRVPRLGALAVRQPRQHGLGAREVRPHLYFAAGLRYGLQGGGAACLFFLWSLQAEIVSVY